MSAAVTGQPHRAGRGLIAAAPDPFRGIEQDEAAEARQARDHTDA